jgi:hypothetical protein
MPLLDEAFAQQARTELPKTWDELANDRILGVEGMEKRVRSVMFQLFGRVLTADEQDQVDNLVAEYAGKKIALKLVGPGLDFWSKQPTQITATGRTEMKSYSNRAEELRKWREIAVVELKEMWLDVEPLLPGFRVPVGSPSPVVELLGSDGHVTPDPDEFEPPFAPPAGGGL